MAEPVVLHSIPVWLPRTQPWIYTQLRFLPATIDAHVVCNAVANLPEFPCHRLHVRAARPTTQVCFDQWIGKARRFGGLSFRAFVARQVGARLVHSHFGHVGWTDLPFVRARSLRHVVTFYGEDVNYLPQRKPWWRLRYRELFAHVDRVLCEGPFMARRVERLGCPTDKVRVHHLGIDTAALSYRPLPWQPGEPLRILMAATFREKKGLSIGLQALQPIAKEYPLKVTVIGDADAWRDSRTEKQRILEVVAQLRQHCTVRMSGFVPYAELLRIALCHHIFIQPSIVSSSGDTEGGAPVALLDMQALGLIVVSTRHCDIPSVMSAQAQHLLAEERNVGQLSDIVAWLVGHPEGWGEIRAANRRHVENEYDARVQAARLAEVYAELL